MGVPSGPVREAHITAKAKEADRFSPFTQKIRTRDVGCESARKIGSRALKTSPYSSVRLGLASQCSVWQCLAMLGLAMRSITR